MKNIHREKEAVVRNWDKGTFGKLHQEDFSLIRETELLTHDKHVDNINWLVREKDLFKSKLIYKNEFISEGLWEDNWEIITRVFLKKQRKAWRQIVSRTPIEEAT